jgi:Ca2+-binding EF-hand superfamily protein
MSSKSQIKDHFATLSFDEKDQIRQIYQKVDKDGDGNVSKEEVKSCLIMLGLSSDDEKVDSLFNELDLDNNSKISKDEFLESMARWKKGVN